MNDVITPDERVSVKCWKCGQMVKLRDNGTPRRHRIGRAYRHQKHLLPVCPASGRQP